MVRHLAAVIALVGLFSNCSESSPEPGVPSGAAAGAVDSPAPEVEFLKSRPIGFPVTGHPKVASTVITDLDRDGLPDVLVCDMLADRIGWIRQDGEGEFEEQWIGPEIKAPARVQAFDIDLDQDLDLLVASMGQLLPTNDKIGSVIILENTGQEEFVAHRLADGIARVTDVRGGDLDGDGAPDLVVAQFGYFEGETRWMRNVGNWQFETHVLQRLSGPIHAIPADMDGDGDLDVVSLVSQEWEEIYLLENDGNALFQYHVIFGSINEDYGSSGMDLVDLDQDGDLDVLFSNGDAFDSLPPRPKPWHAVQWLENKGRHQFDYHRIGNFHGASAAHAADVDADGDVDVVAVSAWNLWEKPQSKSMVWFDNDGGMRFVRRDLANSPTHLICLAAADMNGDGLADFVTGGMNAYPPYGRESRVRLWLNHWKEDR